MQSWFVVVIAIVYMATTGSGIEVAFQSLISVFSLMSWLSELVSSSILIFGTASWKWEESFLWTTQTTQKQATAMVKQMGEHVWL